MPYDHEGTDERKFVVNGGLEVKRMDRLMIDDVHYGMFKYQFDMDELQKNVNPQVFEMAVDAKNHLDMASPTTMAAYVRKFKSYNHILLVQDMLAQLRNKDGPHPVFRARNANVGLPMVHEVKLSQEFCERFTVPQSGNIKLTHQPDDGNEIVGRVLKYDEATQTVQFFVSKNYPVPSGQFIIRFEPSRFVYNARHFILNNGERLQSLISFLISPQPIDKRLTKEEFIDRRDRMMDTLKFSSERFNREQREAIFAIVTARTIRVCNSSGALLPYLIHGPPGTGKTTTLVEAVRLLMVRKHKVAEEKGNRILVCAPSNTAADLFAKELLDTGVNPKEVFRVYALMQPVGELSEELKPISLVSKNLDGLDMFGIPPLAQLLKYRVIITTIMASTYLALGKMSQTFTHIIIDEAGQASELDTLVPIVGLTGPDTKVVLAGDARQLGPIDTVEYFRKNNITKSMVERFETIEYYKDDPRTMTFLKNNYRSHQAIIAVPSQLFYNDELVTAQDAPPRDRLAHWELLPKKGFPMFWHHVQSPEAREHNGYSYMNQGEIDQVLVYVGRIIRELKVEPKDIGIISPYSYQARKLRQRLQHEHPDITVDTVERYQGSQRRVIIVTTVRSNPDDKLGFMNSEKRFNTTITRAEELLIIVGNGKNMEKESSWAQLEDYCRQNKATFDMPVFKQSGPKDEADAEAGGKKRAHPESDESEEEEEEVTDEEETEESSDEDEEEESSGDDEEEESEEDDDEEESNEDGEEGSESGSKKERIVVENHLHSDNDDDYNDSEGDYEDVEDLLA